ncbi:hypothetical protein [Enteractinococcus helveticum]|uniref:Uncharacterized protein n=1 Tax=Enteractinococcus helveticum TaxID=1837282 RepID=A0A1B7LVJ5_9MICC|nr:hypothetical protein [Enteractinococcus helveticum]OAV52980.1 hypothetical protein A6F49_00820 [Enteractinococcus helveticum]
MSRHEGRDIIEAQLRRELFGPGSDEEPIGKPVDCANGIIRFEKKEDSWGQFHDAATKQEILTVGTPLQRYGVGVLYGGAKVGGSNIHGLDDVDLTGISGVATSEDDPDEPPVEVRRSHHHDQADDDDFDLTDANSFKPVMSQEIGDGSVSGHR